MIARIHNRRRPSSGISILEVLVSFTLLTSVLALSTPLVLRHGRVLVTARHYRLAFEELTNQLERLSALPEQEVRSAVESLAPSEFASAHLPGVELKGKLEPAEIGQRLTLEIVWDEPQRREAPLKMTAWLFPGASQAGRRPEAGQP
jgi:hypothetical protein